MQEPKIIKDKRTNYLTHFREGASDAMFNRDQYERKKALITIRKDMPLVVSC